MSANPNDMFGVYVHWPFCAAKCPYCDFNSHVHRGPFDEDGFVAAYEREIASTAALVPGRVVQSIFFGGGTPSLMSPVAVERIIDAIARHWTVERNAEITLEANPTSVEVDRFRGYRTAGVNRVSLGVQSLRPGPLAELGRRHTVDEAVAAVRIAQSVFDRSSFDLIYARPGQTLEDWEDELKEGLWLARGHVSLYQLTIEQGTRYFDLHQAGKQKMPDEDLAADFYELTQELTAEAGMPAYEISNHAVPGQESRHNLLYWRYGEYAGIGAGAHGRVIVEGARTATSTERQPEGWLARVEAQGSGTVERTPLSLAEQADEMLLMGLRLGEGFDLARLEAVSGLAPRPEAIGELIDLGLLEWCGPARVRAAPQGRFILNEIVLRLAAALEPAGRAR